MESIRENVDHIIVLYSSTPTYGFSGQLPNPDSKEDIQKICDYFNAELIDITDQKVSRENVHRELAFKYAYNNKYDIVVAVDYDEVWENLDEAIDYATNGSVFQYGIRGDQWVTLWKSFNEYVTDGFSPIRLFNLHKKKGTEELIYKGKIYHFGYAISDDLMRYKLSTHGHKAEIENTWFKDKWIGYEKGVTKYLHPATDAYWIETNPFDKTELPEFMKTHPKYNE